MKAVLNTFLAVVSCLVMAQCQNPKSGNGGAGQIQVSQQATVMDISASEFKEQMGEPDVVLLDVRTPGEFSEGYIPGAQLIDFMANDFEQQINKLDKDKHYLVYCRSGGRSSQAADMMIDKGFTHVSNLESGIRGWNRQGYEIVK